MGSGSSKNTPQVQTVNQTTSNIPDYAAPYFQDILQRTQGMAGAQYIPYGSTEVTQEDLDAGRYAGAKVGSLARAVDASGKLDANGKPVLVDATRIAAFNPNQTRVQDEVMGMQKYNVGNFSADQVVAERIAAERIAAERAAGASMGAAQTGYNPQLTQYQMAAPDKFGQAQAQQYMSPYIQNVMDVQKQVAVQDAKKAQLAQNLGAARQGTYGGARQLLAATERERALGQQLGGIEATGLQSAYENAQAQFERDRAAGLTTGQANLQAQLGTQQLGTQTGLQTALANLSAEQQANVQNLAAKLQTQGLNVESALRAALANQSSALSASQSNQQTGLQAAISNQQANLEAQRMAEASRQFGNQADLSRLQAQANVGSQQQQYKQQQLDQAYQDFLTQRAYPQEQLSFYSNIMRGLPITPGTTQTIYGQSPSAAAQASGLALTGLSAYNTLNK